MGDNFRDVIRSSPCFRIGAMSGLLTGAGAGTCVFSFRWGDATKKCIVQTFEWWWTIKAAFTTSQLVDHAAHVTRAFTASDSGGTAISLVGNSGVKKTSKGGTLVTDMRIASTGALTNGTKTNASEPFSKAGAWSGTIGVSLPAGAAFIDFEKEGYLWLVKDEGIVLNNGTAMGATGVIYLVVNIAWAEVPLNVEP